MNIEFVNSTDGRELIRVFNMPSEDSGLLHDEEAPNGLICAVTLLTFDPELQDYAIGLVTKLDSIPYEKWTSIFGDMGYNVQFTFDYVSPFWKDALSESQRRWLIDGVYPQCGFFNINTVDEVFPSRGIGMAMLVYDIGRENTGQINPVHFRPITFADLPVGRIDFDGNRIARGYKAAVGRLFFDGIGCWSHELIVPRNEILVKVHAVLSDRDPDVEYARFVQSGGTYFLDYTRLLGEGRPEA